MTFPDKRSARAWARTALRALSPEDRRQRSASAADRLSGTEPFAGCDLVLGFLSMQDEIDTSFTLRAALAAGKTIAAPRMRGESMDFVLLETDWESLPRDGYGIPTPPAGVPALALDEILGRRVLALVPGLLFDAAGGRLGRGKGYYDRFLGEALSRMAERSPDAGEPRNTDSFFIPCGFCFQSQVVDAVPRAAWDVRLPLIATDEAVLYSDATREV